MTPLAAFAGRLAGPANPEFLQRTGLAQGIRSQLQDRLGPWLRPKFLGSFHPLIQPLDRRLHMARRDRQTRLPILGAFHPPLLIPQVPQRVRQLRPRTRLPVRLPRFAQRHLPRRQARDDGGDVSGPQCRNPPRSPANRRRTGGPPPPRPVRSPRPASPSAPSMATPNTRPPPHLVQRTVPSRSPASAAPPASPTRSLPPTSPTPSTDGVAGRGAA